MKIGMKGEVVFKTGKDPHNIATHHNAIKHHLREPQGIFPLPIVVGRIRGKDLQIKNHKALGRPPLRPPREEMILQAAQDQREVNSRSRDRLPALERFEGGSHISNMRVSALDRLEDPLEGNNPPSGRPSALERIEPPQAELQRRT